MSYRSRNHTAIATVATYSERPFHVTAMATSWIVHFQKGFLRLGPGAEEGPIFVFVRCSCAFSAALAAESGDKTQVSILRHQDD